MTFARTKIQPPRPRAAFVERGALQAQLADALASRRIVLLCAPAGYGKTMLLAQGTAHLSADHAIAWVSADEERAVAAELINTLDACDVAQGVIALDDVHRVDDPAFFRFLDRVIERSSRSSRGTDDDLKASTAT